MLFLVRMTALRAIGIAGELTALKPVLIAPPFSGTCDMLGSRENAMSKFHVVFTPPRLLCAILRDESLLESLASGDLKGGIIGYGES